MTAATARPIRGQDVNGGSNRGGWSAARTTSPAYLGLNGREAQHLVPIMTVIDVAPKAAVFYEGDPSDALFEVASGAIKIYKLLGDGREQVTGFLFPGDFLGCALSDAYAYSAEAIGPVRLYRYPRRRIEQLMVDVPQLGRRLLGAAADEIAAAQEQMLLLGRKSPLEKLASFLLNIAARQGAEAADPPIIILPMGRGAIADYLGVTIETVSRSFTQLRKIGVISLRESQIVVLEDLDRLEGLAEGFGREQS